jgi:hypothetical protein
MAGSDEDSDRSRRPGVEDRGWSSTGRVLDGQMIRRSGHAVCGMYRAQGEEERGFLGLASKPRSTVCQYFSLKTTGRFISGLASKPLGRFIPVWPQNWW